MVHSRMIYSLLLASFFALSHSANAAVTTVYDFGSLLTASDGYTPPDSFSSPFATLQATDNGGGTWTFTLAINSNLSSFGSGAFIGSMTFDSSPDPGDKKLPTTFLGSNVGGVTSVKSTSGTGNSGLADVDFGVAFGQGSDKLSQNDWVSWSVSGLSGSSLTNMYVHVQGIDGGYSAKYTPAVMAVPEPDTYAMLLAGFGMLGFMVRRRMNNA